MMSCRRCNKPMKERLVTDEYAGRDGRVIVTGIPAAICSYCGLQQVNQEALEEIEVYLGPILGGGMGMHLLGSQDLSIDLGNSMHPSAIDIAGPSASLRAPASLPTSLTPPGVGVTEEAA